MKLLITGTNGFVGRNLQAHFADRCELHHPKRGELNLLHTDAVRDYLARHRFDAVVHCGVTLANVEDNLKMYFNLERCSSSYGRLVCVGSGAEYDRQHAPPMVGEDFFGRHIPQDIYGFSKYVMAKDVESVHRNIYNLRVFGIYGRHEDHTRRFISNNICRLLAGLDISINRNMAFDYLWVDDFCRILEAFLAAEPTHRSYNVCTGTSVDLVRLAEIIREVDGRDRSITVKQEGSNPEYTGSNARFLEEFGPVDFTPPERAIPELYAWYRDESGLDFDPDVYR